MTTDITELAQRLKLEVHRAVSNFNPQMNIKTRDLKELVEALEKAQRYIEELREWNAGLAQESFERQQRIVELQQGCENDPRIHEIIDLKERIAELESRTVKLPRLPDDCDRIEVHFKYAVALAAAGIKVEAE